MVPKPLFDLSGRAVHDYAKAIESLRVGVDNYIRISELGGSDHFENKDHRKRHPVGVALHLPFEIAES